MSDPVVDAAARAWATIRIPTTFTKVGEASAREALKPIRQLIEDWESTGHLDYGQLRTLVGMPPCEGGSA